MNLIATLLIVGIAVVLAGSPKPLVDQKFTIGDREFRMVIETAPSKSETTGAGFCGSGEEVTMTVYSKAKRKVFSHLIESCLENVELAGGNLGKETTESVMKAVTLLPTAIEVRWFSHDKMRDVRGIFTIESDKVTYSQYPLGHTKESPKSK